MEASEYGPTVVVPVSNESKWKEARLNHITGTDLGKIMGLDPQCSRKALFMNKITGQEPEFSAYARQSMELGKAFEQTALTDFIQAVSAGCVGRTKGYSRKFVPSINPSAALYASQTFPWLAGTPDYLWNGLLCEVKTHFYPDIESAKPFRSSCDIPLKYYLQVQAYMEIFDVNLAHLISWTLNHGYCIFYVSRDFNLMNGLVLPKCEKFFNDLKNVRSRPDGVIPPNLWSVTRVSTKEKQENGHAVAMSLMNNVEMAYISYTAVSSSGF